MTPEEARMVLTTAGIVILVILVAAMLCKIGAYIKRKFPNFILNVEMFFLASFTFAYFVSIVLIILRAMELI